MSYLSFLSASVSIPVWLLLLMIGGMTPLFIKLYQIWRRYRRKERPEMQESQSVFMRLVSITRSATPGKSATAISKAKNHEHKTHMAGVLKVMAPEGDKGMLLQSIAERMNTPPSRVKEAIERLMEKQLIEEVAGISGTKYYLTDVGKNYCRSKGLLKAG